METHPLGDEIATIEASDRDEIAPYDEIRYSLVGNALGAEYFLVNERTGQIFQRRAIQYDPEMTKEYTVSAVTCVLYF